MKYYIRTFGCQQNKADSEKVEADLINRGMKPASEYRDANYVVINTCMVRQSAEDRIYGLVCNLSKIKKEKEKQGEIFKIIIIGCLAGAVLQDKSGKFFSKVKKKMPAVDEFLSNDQICFDNNAVRQSKQEAFVTISSGCNNFCSFCIVPFSKGREKSRPYNLIIKECRDLHKKGYKRITLLGQNVNSYGADLPMRNLRPVYVKHLGKLRIPTLFPHLLKEIAEMKFEEVNFISSNPWDFSSELIDVIASNENITRTLHLPLQSGDNNVLKRMNRWYTAEEYFNLIRKIRKKVPKVRITTDIIVGFCGETEDEFKNTVKLVKKVGFEKAYIAIYTPRPFTAAIKIYKDDVPYDVKKKRWRILEEIIN